MSSRFLPLLAGIVLLLAACGTPGPTKRPVPIAGGKVVGIQFGPNGPLPGRENGYEVQAAAGVPGKVATELVYKFAFSVPAETTLKRVVVDDISDEQSGQLIDDQKPWVDAQLWLGETKPIANKDPSLAWIYTVTPSMRVYRFTITDSQDKVTVLYQVTGYPPYMKGAIRASWGEKY